MTASAVSVLVSGGLDSCVMAAELASRGRTVQPLYIRQGLRWEAIELYWLKRFLRAEASRRLKPLEILSLPVTDLYGTHWSTRGRSVPDAQTPDSAVYLPGRNLLLTVKAAIFCALHRIPSLALASLDANPFPDATPVFFKSWQNIVSRGLDWKLQIMTPYRRLSKAAVITRGRMFALGLSFSCLAPQGRRHCGRCNKCAERRGGFRAAGVTDPTAYAKD